MLRRRFRPRESSRSIAAVAIAGDELGAETEGVIERVRRVGAEVDVRMLLSDGGTGVARLDVHEWDWLELSVGDIVAVTLLSA
jgi:hypothetical protein